jgi:hypothetical protein
MNYCGFAISSETKHGCSSWALLVQAKILPNRKKDTNQSLQRKRRQRRMLRRGVSLIVQPSTIASKLQRTQRLISRHLLLSARQVRGRIKKRLHLLQKGSSLQITMAAMNLRKKPLILCYRAPSPAVKNALSSGKLIIKMFTVIMTSAAHGMTHLSMP